MRRFIKDKTFKGTVNLEFGTKEEAEEFIKKQVMFAGVELKEKELLSDREANFEERNVRLFKLFLYVIETLYFQSGQHCSVP